MKKIAAFFLTMIISVISMSGCSVSETQPEHTAQPIYESFYASTVDEVIGSIVNAGNIKALCPDIWVNSYVYLDPNGAKIPKNRDKNTLCFYSAFPMTEYPDTAEWNEYAYVKIKYNPDGWSDCLPEESQTITKVELEVKGKKWYGYKFLTQFRTFVYLFDTDVFAENAAKPVFYVVAFLDGTRTQTSLDDVYLQAILGSIEVL